MIYTSMVCGIIFCLIDKWHADTAVIQTKWINQENEKQTQKKEERSVTETNENQRENE